MPLLVAMSKAATAVIFNGFPNKRPLVSRKLRSTCGGLSLGGVACQTRS